MARPLPYRGLINHKKIEAMKRFLLYLPLLAIAAIGFIGCSQKREWNHQQRQAMRQALREYRDMVYLNDLTDAEYLIFTDEVATDLETAYPVYTTFIEMPGVEDTVDLVVVETIVDYLNADAHNMRHIYPYSYLVAEGVLPAGLDMRQQRQFYSCFAQQVNNEFVTMNNFVSAILADTTANSQIRQIENGCANTLFGWVVTEVDIVE